MRRRRHGLTLEHVNGAWVTRDGVTTIGRISAIEECEAAHPMRYRNPQGVLVGGHCPGFEEHDREVGWGFLEGRPGWVADDLYATLDEVWAVLAKYLTVTA